MTVERHPLSSLTERVNLAFRKPQLGRTEFEDAAYRRNDLIVYQVGRGKNSYVATVNINDIFDCDGNRFDEDE